MINPSGGILSTARSVALAVIATLASAATVAALVESYHGLYLWAAGHGYPPGLAAIWPLLIDTFVTIGELVLFVSLLYGWPARSRIGAWASILAGLAASVAENAGHAAAADWVTRLGWAGPPLAAAGSLALALSVLKRVIASHRPAGAPRERKAAAPASLSPADDTRSEIARVRARRVTAQRARPGDRAHKAALEAYRASVSAGDPLSARQLAADHLGGNRRAAGRVITAAKTTREQ